jgi:copper chaperone
MPEFTLKIDGMHCGSCVRRVSQALARDPGVVVNEVRVGAARLTAAEEPAPVDLGYCRDRQGRLTAHLES